MRIQELMNLNGRVALITGAAGSLGCVMAETLAELGADIILVDRPGSDFKSLSNSLNTHWGTKVWEYDCDLENNKQRLKFLEIIKNEHRSLNILVNNAAFVGTSDLKGWSTKFENQTVETWRRALEVNLTAPFHLCQGLTPILRESAGASIINIGSIYGQSGPDWGLYEGTDMSNPAAYASSKGGLMQLTRWLSSTLAPIVRVNAISPGGILRDQPKVFIKRYEEKIPLARMATEDDFQGAITYLASDLSKYVTGQVLVVDGGWSV